MKGIKNLEKTQDAVGKPNGEKDKEIPFEVKATNTLEKVKIKTARNGSEMSRLKAHIDCHTNDRRFFPRCSIKITGDL